MQDLMDTLAAVRQYNDARWAHPRLRAWLAGRGREPSIRSLGMISTQPADRILTAVRRGDTVPEGDISRAVATLRRALTR